MRKRKGIMIVTALAMVCVLAVGISLAMLKDVTETAENTFASTKDISIVLREPAWDGYDFTDDEWGKGKTINPDAANPDALGLSIARNYVPGDQVPKNPVIKNQTEPASIDAYVALKVEFIDTSVSPAAEMTYEEFAAKYGTIVFDTESWKLISDDSASQLYQYNTVLEAGATTEAHKLFDEVVLNKTIEPDASGKMPSFNIKVTAYAVQAKNVNAADAATELLELAGF